jgi:MFS family permease
MSLAASLAQLWRLRGFRRLAYTRLLSQSGDGVFQVAIATTIFFDPTQAASVERIALGFAVLLAPFTLVGPFVGPLIDRWQRQRIILIGNLIRLGLAGLLLTVMLTGGPAWLLLTLALLTLSVNRFLLAAMTAGVPQVVPRAQLLTANSVLPTLGTLAAALGAAVGGAVTFIAPRISDTNLASTSLLVAGIAFGLSSSAAMLLGKRELGPVTTRERLHLAEQFKSLAFELRTGARFLYAAVTPFHGLAVMGAQRLLYGLMFVASILISRHILGDPEQPEQAIEKFSLVLLCAAVGFGIAAILTPLCGERIGRQQWIVLCLLVGAAGQTLLAISSDAWAVLSAAAVVSFAVQGSKIAVDTIVHRDTTDEVRGRAFTLYDVVYNVAFIASAGIGALVLPDTGYSRPVMIAIVGAYLLVAAVYSRAPRDPRPLSPTTVRELASE